MSKVDNIAKEFEKLSKREREELIKKLLDKMELSEVIELLGRIRNENEVLEILKVIEPVFLDWNNSEDSIYDNL
ncbi:MAG: hypothetical protein ACOX1Y_12765 [Zhaonellaceae bacterium]|jgi:hypothetical protein|nr:hypothetical protein [Clostridia bacterium]